ncbi:NAD(P)/FAD-dependent oxidoreductase [Enterococcus sp.]|uniref:dihydrolipoyl dehydrogenase family protein n=1 Tax=Enterococcus sp. TaxID=35783 RepID=UPI0028A03F4E|nr:NAD(P)/FAD-dependent oxidoreductase [Enterococcus sp.]
MKKVDVLIIGAGPAGTAAAYGLKAKGKTVAIVEADLWGGTCPNRGCDPKKLLMRGVEVKTEAKRMQGNGVQEEVSIDWPTLMAFKRSYTDRVPESTKQGLLAEGITTYYGQATFRDAHTVVVGAEEIQAEKIIIATGQRLAVLPIVGKEHLQSSTDFLSFEKMPATIAFIGAGYITFELAMIAQAAGAEVHVIHHNDQPLKGFDAELTTKMVRSMQDQGVSFHFNQNTQRITKEQNRYTIQTQALSLSVEAVIGATGRRPNSDQLQLEKAGVETSKQGIVVNEFLQTSQRHIYAIGDVLAKKQPKLTPVASFEAAYLVEHIDDQKMPIRYPLIPTLVFGAEKLARIGISEQEIADNASEYHSEVMDLSSWYTYRRINDQEAKIKLVYDTSDTIVAVTVFSALADELINYFVFVLENQLSKEAIAKMIFAYPTPASDLPYFL